MDELYRGWALGVGEKPTEGGQYHPQGDKQQCCVFSRAQKLPQSTWQAQTVVSSSLTPQTALLVPITGPIDPVQGGVTLVASVLPSATAVKQPVKGQGAQQQASQ